MSSPAASQPVQQILSREGVTLPVLTRSDLANIPVTPGDVIEAVRGAYLRVAQGSSVAPAKIMMRSPHRDSVAYAMPGYDGGLHVSAFKDYYMQNDEGKKEYITITLYDDKAGAPIAFMDCTRVTTLRTAASTALIAAACAPAGARTALVSGSGAQGRETFPFLLDALPDLERLLLFATHPDGIASVRAYLREQHPDRDIEVVTDPEKAAGESDVMVATSAGPATNVKLRTSWLKPGALFISVNGTGVHPSSLRDADYAVATSPGQLAVTGRRFANEDGSLPLDAQLPDILAGKAPARRDEADRVFVFNSGMAITDIPVAHALATQAIALGRGQEIRLWS
ncbi:ornithine cyclodeaminase [Mycobacterium xenopi]|uniref:Ornithine cyclodeaminase n=1 Tax=Mycobacterium xenopi TaxID=1789 RepID=A0AAD1M0W4_MYCXE|nr:ornithine cyclodeaminase [Mycobacterium xenopi]MDA3641286.1 ornithine cyclodeaminase [Mycobacterium xenopi]MDA3659030.1 ornithine cyclodeaminase [Mycobacterium xenopi]MDA3663497.1 ornithine cyclodeaminase [Mycobacterium xenopi]ORX18230.1 ornithine cyclodeaminase [Mycobacterium xenopi]SPX78310.1 ornithine cyclodeaminase [Mycobacterium xenopi]